MSDLKYFRKTEVGEKHRERVIYIADGTETGAEVARFPITLFGTAAYEVFCDGVHERGGKVVSYLFQFVGG